MHMGRLILSLCPLLLLVRTVTSWSIAHYLDYLPYRQEGLAAFEDFRTAPTAPSALRNRKMQLGPLQAVDVEDVLLDPIWPKKWPYGTEDFRPFDYTRDEIIPTMMQYQYSQSLIASDHIIVVPGLLRVPIKRHFILPKDMVALNDHYSQYFFDGANVLELFSVYESILPRKYRNKLGATVGIGWYDNEMKCNEALDDYIEQDISVDPYLPLQSNYFDFVVMPANFQLLQRPKELFQEINRVLKPGGMAIIGVKLALWSFLGVKQGRYFAETNYLEDVLTLGLYHPLTHSPDHLLTHSFYQGSFFHYAGGFTKPEAYDLTLPEVTTAGKIKDLLFPQPRLDFYACVQAKKRKDSPHGAENNEESKENPTKGLRYQPKKTMNSDDMQSYSPYY